MIEELKVGLLAWVKAEGERRVRQPDALEEVLRMAREDLGYKRLTPWRAMEQVVRPVWRALEDGD